MQSIEDRNYTNPSFGSNYRLGFNGKEKDEEGEFGSLTHYDYGFRIYNPAIGKFLSVDPLTASYPWYTPYQFAGNTPIMAIDLDGLEEKISVISDIDDKTKIKVTSFSITDDDRKKYSKDVLDAFSASTMAGEAFSSILNDAKYNANLKLAGNILFGLSLTQNYANYEVKEATIKSISDGATYAASKFHPLLGLFVHFGQKGLKESMFSEDGLMNLENGLMAENYSHGINSTKNHPLQVRGRELAKKQARYVNQINVSYIPYVDRLEFSEQIIGYDKDKEEPITGQTGQYRRYYYGTEIFQILSSPNNTNPYIKFGIEERVETERILVKPNEP